MKASPRERLGAYNKVLIPFAGAGFVVLTLEEVGQERTYGWVLLGALIIGQLLALLDEISRCRGRWNDRAQLTLTACGGGAAFALVSLANPALVSKAVAGFVLLGILFCFSGAAGRWSGVMGGRREWVLARRRHSADLVAPAGELVATFAQSRAAVRLRLGPLGNGPLGHELVAKHLERAVGEDLRTTLGVPLSSTLPDCAEAGVVAGFRVAADTRSQVHEIAHDVWLRGLSLAHALTRQGEPQGWTLVIEIDRIGSGDWS